MTLTTVGFAMRIPRPVQPDVMDRIEIARYANFVSTWISPERIETHTRTDRILVPKLLASRPQRQDRERLLY